MNEQKLALWDKFCNQHRIQETGVHLFKCDSSERVASAPFGKDGRRILCRSVEMEALIVREVSRILSSEKDQYEGLLYMMHWRDDAGGIIPLYIGRAGRYGRDRGKISANLSDVEKDKSKFARWGSGYDYHIGDLSAAACKGHKANKIVKKYSRWASCLFTDAPAETPMLRRPVYFWATAWGRDSYNIWLGFGSCSLSFQEYLLIGVASELFPSKLLNNEGVNNPSTVDTGPIFEAENEISLF